MKTASIVIKDLSIGYFLKRNKKVLKEYINQSLYRGEVTCLIGANGSGKSTLLRTIAGFHPPLSGEISYEGKSVSQYPESERALLFGLVLTDKIFAGGLSVFDLVSFGRHPHTRFLGTLKSHDEKIILDSMEKVGITYKLDSYVSELSDGERQKVMIAKALAQECPVILLDEPTAFLDAGSRIEIMRLLKELAMKENKSILLSTHDIESAIQMGDRFWLMDKVRPFTSGMPEDLILDDVFNDFFDRNQICFDKQTGSLQIIKNTNKEMFLSGDALCSLWMANALRKNGFEPKPGEIGYPLIDCRSKNNYILMKSENSQSLFCENIESILSLL